ncbi:MAG: hypothetical protein DSZ03_00805 [Sulfurimonas sp.]|nr:MAG: hypothetical protein DSZ03_00805 [Sulfurimonas sp.]
MRGNNFVAFLTVQGFFLGLAFAVLQARSATDILTYTALITIFFYLFSHLVIAMYYRTYVGKKGYFPKASHERELDYFIREIEKREVLIDQDYDIGESQSTMGTAAATQKAA